MRGYTLSPRPNLFFDGEVALVDWLIHSLAQRKKRGAPGSQALLIRNNGVPKIVDSTRITASEFIEVVGIYNVQATKEQVQEDIRWFWIRNIGSDETA